MQIDLDHLVVLVDDFAQAYDTYQDVLGTPLWREDDDGAFGAMFELAGVGIELIAPSDISRPRGARLRDILASQGPGLVSLALALPELEAPFAQLEAARCQPEPIVDGQRKVRGLDYNWRRTRLTPPIGPGLRLFLLHRAEPLFSYSRETFATLLISAAHESGLKRALGVVSGSADWLRFATFVPERAANMGQSWRAPPSPDDMLPFFSGSSARPMFSVDGRDTALAWRHLPGGIAVQIAAKPIG